MKSNKAIVAAFYKYVIKERNEILIDTYVHEKYIQHSPAGKDGREGLREMIVFLKTLPAAAEKTSPIKLLLEDGDMVADVLSFSFMGKKMLVVDLFRLKDGKAAEHWDAIQEISPETEINAITIEPGADLLQNKKMVQATYQQEGLTVHRIIGEGDIVLVQAEVYEGGKHFARYDILRVNDNQITVCLSVQQPIPEVMMHDNGVF